MPRFRHAWEAGAREAGPNGWRMAQKEPQDEVYEKRDRERRGEPREERDQELKGKAYSKETNFLWEAGHSSGRRVPQRLRIL